MASGLPVRVVFSDVRHNFLVHYILAAAVMFSATVVFGIGELNERLAAQPLEMFSAIAGAVLMTPVFMPEQDESICDLVSSKKTDHMLICLFRLICSVLVSALLTGALALYIRSNSSDVTLRVYISAVTASLAIGSLGFFTSAVTDNTVSGYMVTAVYYMMNIFQRKKLGYFDLFTFSDGKSEISYILLTAAFVLIVSAAAFRKIKYCIR